MAFNNARPWPQPVRNKGVSPNTNLPAKSKFAESRVNLGMITMLDPADIEPGALQLAQNARCRFDRTQRRPGTELMIPTKPNSNPVIGLFFFKKNDGTTYYFRFTPSTMHHRAGGIWTNVPAAAAAKAKATLTGTTNFANAETVTIGTKTNTFETVLTNVDGNVFIGVDLAASLANLKDAINLGPGAGTDYAAATTLHPTVDGTTLTATALTVEAKTAGIAGNNIVVSTTALNADWGLDVERLSGGLNAGSLIGLATDYIQAAVVLDRFAFSNNGKNVLQEYDHVAVAYKPLGNAPEYRYVTGFFNRVVAANLSGGTPNAVLLGWSGENNITEWDPLRDETAGSTPLVESPGDLGDDISGVFGFTNVLAILREQSIWLATKQPIPTFPFNPYAAFPGVGCNAPYSAKITSNGLTWADRRSGTVWHYTPGSAPEPIGRPVEKTLMDAIDDEDLIFASYDPIQNEYTVCIPLGNSAEVVAWTYNFRTQAWTKDIYEGLSTISDADLGSATTTIDQLPGLIQNLLGDIDSLGPTQVIVPTRAFGREDGEITIQNEDVSVDPVFSGSTGEYETVLLSKAFTLPTDDIYVAEIRVEVIPISGTTLTLRFSKDGGPTISTASKSKSYTGTDLGKSQIFTWTKQIKCRRFAWQLSSVAGQFHVVSYEVHVYKGGESAK
jgi:hypothetical protein